MVCGSNPYHAVGGKERGRRMKLRDLFAVTDENLTVKVHYVSEKTDFAISNTVAVFNIHYFQLLEEEVINVTRDEENDVLMVEVGGAK